MRLRIVLTRRWGQRGTGFTEHDVHRINDEGDPRTLPPVTIDIVLEEPESGAWDQDMVAALEDVMTILPRGTNGVTVRVTCAWNPDREAFDPRWEFLDTAGQPMTGKAQRATNLTGFFAYLPLFWLNALRDAPDEFTSRSVHWGQTITKRADSESSRMMPSETLADSRLPSHRRGSAAGGNRRRHWTSDASRYRGGSRCGQIKHAPARNRRYAPARRCHVAQREFCGHGCL